MLTARSDWSAAHRVQVLLRHAHVTSRRLPEDEIHTVMGHVDVRWAPSGMRKGLTLRSIARAKYVPLGTALRDALGPATLAGVPYPTLADLPHAAATPRAPHGRLAERGRLYAFNLWRQHSKLPDVYREIVREFDAREVLWHEFALRPFPLQVEAFHAFVARTAPAEAIRCIVVFQPVIQSWGFDRMLSVASRDADFEALTDFTGDRAFLAGVAELRSAVQGWSARVEAALSPEEARLMHRDAIMGSP